MRENGCYWIKNKHGGEITIGQWTNVLNIWVILGCDECHLDKEFEVVGDKIEQQVEVKVVKSSKRTLYVTKTTIAELDDRWGFKPPFVEPLYIQCRHNGQVNWDNASVYTADAVNEDHIVIVNKE